MDKLEATLMAKVQDLQGKIEKTDNVEELGKLTTALSELLNSLEKVKENEEELNERCLGSTKTFPSNIHRTETFTSSLSKRKLQQKITQVFQEVNRKTFSFEEVGNPTVPNCTVIFEFGIADAENFSYLG